MGGVEEESVLTGQKTISCEYLQLLSATNDILSK